MKKHFFSFLYLFIIGSAVYGQDYAEMGKHQVVLKFAPLAMFDLDNTYSVAVEIPFSNPKFSVQQEIGYGHAATNIWYLYDDYKPRKYNIRAKSQFRYYYFEGRMVRGYLAGEYFFKRALKTEKEWIGQDCNLNGACNFLKQQDIKYAKVVHAFHPKLGWQFYFGSRFSLDVYTGFGFRFVDHKVLTKNVLENPRPFTGSIDWWGSWEPGTQFYPSFSGGFQVGIRLGKVKTVE